ncbi:uncharacterized protein LOC122829244 [Gambusia affinis]|uniref:uncharacterized protein LOC122829244 n=1 Tax=Gambusia affinis TaxID=33528 RepID=UPI001CDC021F|nr:uncharacterized protein LOC122829244 [Gambusia affinis]
MQDNFLLKSEEMAKTANTCMNVEEPKETISNETISSKAVHKENTSYIIVDPDNKELVVPTLQDSNVIVETHAPQPAQTETSAATTERSKYTHYISLDTNSQHSGTSLHITSPECDQEQISTLGGGPLKRTQDTERSKESEILFLRFLSVKGVPDCELRQRISLEQKHKRQQTLDSQRFGVPEEESNQAFLLLERHCDHRSCLIKETAKKDYYKRQYIKSQAELYKMFSKLEKFNVCFEENVTEFENVSLACLNLQKEIFKVKSEKEHYINQFLQFHAELLRVHSMWQDLKIELENKMFEFEDTSPSCSTMEVNMCHQNLNKKYL